MADTKLSALTAASQLSSTDEFYIAQGIGTTPVSRRLALSALRTWYNVMDYGAKGDGSTDDWAAITAAITACPAGGTVFFPVGTFIISKPLDITKSIRLSGADMFGSCIKTANAGAFTGYFMIRNWTDTQSATATMPTVSTGITNWHPRIDNLYLLIHAVTSCTCVGWYGFQEASYIRDIILDKTSDSQTCRGIQIRGPIQGVSSIGPVTVYNGGTYKWGTELLVDAASAGANIAVTDWTTMFGEHCQVPFYFGHMESVIMRNIHSEAYPVSSLSNVGIIHVQNVNGFELCDSFMCSNTPTAFPLIRVENSHGSGYQFNSPTIRDVYLYNTATFTGNIIEDAAQSGNIQNLAVSKYPTPLHIRRYDGKVFEYDSCPASGVVTKMRYDLFAGGSQCVQWSGIDPPSAGTWGVGDKAYNIYPDYGAYVGWVCVTAGTPGTWQGFGLIDTVNPNLIKQSATFDNAWSPSHVACPRAVTQQGPAVTGLLGTLATKIADKDTTANQWHWITQNQTLAGAYNFSCYVLPAEYTVVDLYILDGATEVYSRFTLSGAGSVSNHNGATGTITQVGSWYRCSISATISAGTIVRIIPKSGGYYTGAGSNGGTEADSGLYVLGAQLTAGATLLDYHRRD